MNINASLKDTLQRIPLQGTAVVLSSILAAHLIATGGQPAWWVLLLQLLAGTALSWSGIILGACFDRTKGRREPQQGSPPAGWIPPHRAWISGAGLMVSGLGLAALAGGSSLRVAVALGLATLAYQGLLKGTLLGPVLMGACRYMHWMLGLAVLPVAAGSQALALPVFLYAAAVTVLAETEPRGADPGTTRMAAALLGLAALMVVALVATGRLGEPLALAPVALAILPLAYWLRGLIADGNPAAVRTLVHRLRLGMIPLDALLLLGSGHWLAAPALLLLLTPGPVLVRRRHPTPRVSPD